MGEHEAAGAVRGLGLARVEARLPEERGLLVARDTRDRQRLAEQPPLADDARRRVQGGQEAAIDPEQREQLVVPLEPIEIEQHRAGGVRVVGRVDPPVGELPDEPRVDRAERELAGWERRAREQPLELAGREVGVGHEPGARAHEVAGQLGATLGRPPILPDDRARDRSRGAALPQHGRLALVRDPDRLQLLRGDARRCDGVARGLDDAAPDLVGIVLDPARAAGSGSRATAGRGPGR